MAPVPFRKLSSYAIIAEPAPTNAQATNRHQPNIHQLPRQTKLVQWGQVTLHQLGADKPDPFAPTMETSQVEPKSASARQSEQGDVKEEGIGLLAMPDD